MEHSNENMAPSQVRGWIAAHRIRRAQISDPLGIDVATVSAKINGHSDWRQSEIQALHDNLYMPIDIFFSHDDQSSF